MALPGVAVTAMVGVGAHFLRDRVRRRDGSLRTFSASVAFCVMNSGTVALSAIDVYPADGSALNECLDPASHVFTEHFSTSI